jgi:hypothetical protein
MDLLSKPKVGDLQEGTFPPGYIFSFGVMTLVDTHGLVKYH